MDIAREKLDFNTAMEESPSSRTSSAATDVMVDPNLTVMRRVTPLPFEMVVREYMSRSKTTTSLWHAYQRGERRFCGHEVPEDRLRCRQRNGSSITHIPPCCCCDERLYVLLNMTVLHCQHSCIDVSVSRIYSHCNHNFSFIVSRVRDASGSRSDSTDTERKSTSREREKWPRRNTQKGEVLACFYTLGYLLC